MVDRFVVWLSAGIVAAGLSAATLAGAGVAIATEDASPDGDGTTTSESSNSTENKADSDTETADTPTDDADEPTTESPDPAETDEEATGDEATDDEAAEPEVENGAPKPDSDTVASDHKTTAPATPKSADASDESDAVETEADDNAAPKKDEEDVAEAIDEPEASVQRTAVVIDTAAVDTAAADTEEETPEVEAVAFASAAAAEADALAAAPPLQGLLNVIGTIVFNIYGLVTRAVGGPPVLPANSTVTVRSSSLVLECGCDEDDTIEVPADWYIPEIEEGQAPPDQLIYLQHGFLAQGPWYSHTAAALAEQTKSIVVAPSITSNFLASDACWLGASPMHEAIAGLFDDGNTALADSALAAGYDGLIPDRVVLMGHSLGGGAVAGTAGFMADKGTTDRLAGVVMLDGVPLNGTAAESLGKEELADIPIYQLAAPKYFWNQFGVGTDALLEARPNQFIGVTLVGGAHVDTMRGGNPLIQFSQQLVSGFSTQENVAAAQILMVGWVNDMFAGTQDEGIYLNPGEERTIDTPAGEATLVDLPNSLEKPFFLNPLGPLVRSLGDGFFTFEPTCVAESMGTAGCTDSVAA
jgi:pimeloyl-ACP methyl ester carboxylesterase